MRGLLILAVVLAVLTFFLPLILGFAFILVCAVAVFVLLARFGLLPGMTVKSYTFDARGRRDDRSEAARGASLRDELFSDSRSPGGWYQEEQDGEIVTLPGDSLKRDGENN